MQLDEQSSVPLYVQLEQQITGLIEDGEFKTGDRIPTEQELGRRFGVSRVTVRKALKPLAERGLLERKTGKGTFIAERKLSRSLSNVISFSQMCRMQGAHPGGKTLRIDLVPATAEDIEKLHLTDGELVLLLQRLRYADGVPVMIETTRFPERFFFLMDEDLNDTSLYEILARHHIRMSTSIKTLDIALADYKEAKYLKVPLRHSLLSIASVAESADGKYAHTTCQLCVTDRFKLYV